MTKTSLPLTKTQSSLIVWLLLVLLSGIGAYIGEFAQPNNQNLIFILLILVIKAQLIIDYFMMLKKVKALWRLTMSAFSVVISIVIWFVL